MPALEPLPGLRVVADPAALDARALARPDDVDRPALRARTTRSRSAPTGVEVDDPDAIVEPEAGFVGAWLAGRAVVARHIEWPLPTERPALAQGSIAGVPAKLWLPGRRRGAASLTASPPTPTSSPDAPAMSELHATPCRRSAGDEPKSAYDVVIVGGGGHGLSTAYYLATRHGITNVAVLEADYIASGNTGRNTTIIRANYGIPEAIRFYQHSLELYQGLEAETGAAILHQTKGIFWLAHTEMAMRTERARCLDEHGLRREDRACVTPGRAQGAHPAARPDRRRPLPGPRRARTTSKAATARHDRVAWAFAAGASQRGVHVLQHTPVTGAPARRRPGRRASRRRAGRSPPVSCFGGRRPGDADGRPRPASGCRSGRIRSTRS